jgi:hypothetical protein
VICLSDNDIIHKLAACDLLDDALAALSLARTDVYVLPTAKYKFRIAQRNVAQAEQRYGAEVLALDARHDKDKVIRTAIRYFQTHQARMQYDQFRSEGFPLGSGSIESGVRRIVNLRLKGASLFWRPETWKPSSIFVVKSRVVAG